MSTSPSTHRGTQRRLGPLLSLLLFIFASLATPTTAQAREPRSRIVRVPLTIHVATKDGRSVVNEQQVISSVRRANRELVAYDVHLVVKKIVPMRGGANVETQTQRFELARRARRDGSVHIFFVDRVKLTNPRKGDRRVSGMHWRYRGWGTDVRAHEYLAVAHNAPTTTLVHEVGHAFGLSHDTSVDNLMCSCRRGHAPTFTKRQGRRLRVGAKRFLRRAR